MTIKIGYWDQLNGSLAHIVYRRLCEFAHEYKDEKVELINSKSTDGIDLFVSIEYPGSLGPLRLLMNEAARTLAVCMRHDEYVGSNKTFYERCMDAYKNIPNAEVVRETELCPKLFEIFRDHKATKPTEPAEPAASSAPVIYDVFVNKATDRHYLIEKVGNKIVAIRQFKYTDI